MKMNSTNKTHPWNRLPSKPAFILQRTDPNSSIILYLRKQFCSGSASATQLKSVSMTSSLWVNWTHCPRGNGPRTSVARRCEIVAPGQLSSSAGCESGGVGGQWRFGCYPAHPPNPAPTHRFLRCRPLPSRRRSRPDCWDHRCCLVRGWSSVG